MSTQKLNANLNRNFTIQISNETERVRAFELEMYDRKVNEFQKDILTKNNDSFIIIPAQIILAPQDSEIINITYIGSKDYDYELAYRLKVKEVYLEMSEDFVKQKETVSARLIVLSNVVKSFFITNPRFEENLSIKEFTNNNEILSIKIENTGTKQAQFSLYDPKLFYKLTDSSNNTYTVKSNLPYILAKTTIIDNIKIPLEVQGSIVNVEYYRE